MMKREIARLTGEYNNVEATIWDAEDRLSELKELLDAAYAALEEEERQT